MPMKSAAQARLMEGIAHGWKPTGMKKPPSRAVAREFVSAGMAKRPQPPKKNIVKALLR